MSTSIVGEQVMHRKRLGAVVGVIGLHLTAGAAMGQSSTPASPYPANDSPVTLPSGTVVRVRNLVVFAELVDLHGASGGLGPLAQVTVGVCRTQACLEMREKPGEMFFFVARPDGSWRAVASPAP